jgi:hypothetical protein
MRVLYMPKGEIIKVRGGILFAGVMTSEIRNLNLELTTYLGATLFFSFEMNLEY